MYQDLCNPLLKCHVHVVVLKVAGAIVIACIASKLYIDISAGEKYCLFYITVSPISIGTETIACKFGIACGAVAVFLAVVFCALDFMVDVNGRAESIRRPVIAVGSGLAVIMALLWVSCFVYL